MVALAPVEDVANDVVNDLSTQKKLSDKVLKEVNDFRQSDRTAPEKLNLALAKASTNANLPELEIVDSAADHVTLGRVQDHNATQRFSVSGRGDAPATLSSTTSGAKADPPTEGTQSDGEVTVCNEDVIYGDPNQQNKQAGFNINKDGSATHVIEPGEKVWNLVKAELWTRAGHEPSDADVCLELKRLKDCNPQIEDFSKVKPGDELNLPKETVDEANAKLPKQPTEGGTQPADAKTNEGGKPVDAKANEGGTQPSDADKSNATEVHKQTDGTTQTVEHDAAGNVKKVTVQKPNGEAPKVYERDATDQRTWHISQGGKKLGDFQGDIRIESNKYVYDDDTTHRHTEVDENGHTKTTQVHEQTDGTKQTIEYDTKGKPMVVTVEDPNRHSTIVYTRDSDDERCWHYIGSDGNPKTFHGAIFIDGDKYVYENDDTHKRTKIDKQGKPTSESMPGGWFDWLGFD